MPVHQVPDDVVLGFDRRTVRLAVVGEGEQRRRAACATARRQRIQPSLSTRGRAALKRSPDHVRQKSPHRRAHRDSGKASRSGRSRSPAGTSERRRWIAIDKQPLLAACQSRRQIADVRSRAASQVEDAQRRRLRQVRRRWRRVRFDDRAATSAGSRSASHAESESPTSSPGRCGRARQPFYRTLPPRSADDRARAARRRRASPVRARRQAPAKARRPAPVDRPAGR